MTITIYPIAGICAMICLWIGKKIGEAPDMKNTTALDSLMSEKHTLREWMILMQQHPELREEFEKMVKPKEIE